MLSPASIPSSRRRRSPRKCLSNVDEPSTFSGKLGTTSNLINTIVGAGIIGIPYSFKESGMVAGLVLLVLVGYMTDKSLRMLVETAFWHPKLHKHGVLTYEDLMSIPYGKVGNVFVLTGMFIMAYGAMVAYLLIIKDTVPLVIGVMDDGSTGTGSFMQREFVMIVTSLFIILPLSLLRDVASLSFTSIISVSADVLLVLFIIVYAPIEQSISDAGGIAIVASKSIVTPRLFIGLGVLSTAMSCQHSAFLVSTSLSNKSPHKWAIVSKLAISTSTVLCVFMGTAGYLGFLDQTEGDILNNFSSGTFQANTARALLAITMFFTYPMESFVARHVLAQLIYGGSMDEDDNDNAVNDENRTSDHKRDDHKTTMTKQDGIVAITQTTNNSNNQSSSLLSRLVWYCSGSNFIGRREKLTIGVYLAALIPALIVDDIGPVLSITGAIGASTLAYIGPGLVYLGINGDAFLDYVSESLLRNNKSHSNNRNSDNSAQSPLEVTTGFIELHVAEDGNNNINNNAATIDVQSVPTKIATADPFSHVLKPWWWYIGGFPLWVAIATTGSIGTKKKLEEAEKELRIFESNNINDAFTNNDGEYEHHDYSDTIKPRIRDYYISIFFIIFGSIAAIIGLVSNIYVQMGNIF